MKEEGLPVRRARMKFRGTHRNLGNAKTLSVRTSSYEFPKFLFSEQVKFAGAGDGLGTAAHPQLAEDIVEVFFNGADGQE